MKKSKFTILLLFLVMILSISAVSAADTNDTSDSDLQAVDEAPVDEVASTDVGALAATDSSNVLSTGGGNFAQIQETINNLPNDTSEITLESNYTRVGDEAAIVLNKSVRIIGNGFTIDGNNNGGIFEIRQGAIVILQNVILINGNADDKGGAIYNEGDLIIQNSILSGNNASLGGAVYNNGLLEISGSTFENNNASEGLSIYNNGTLRLSGNTINGPIVTTGDGVITTGIKVTVLNNEVKTTNDEWYTLRATITDDNGNVIKQIGNNLFKFTVDDLGVFDATYNNNEYTASVRTGSGIFTVNVTYVRNNLIVSSKEKNLINFRGTYTDLQNLINVASISYVLPYNFTYHPVVDAANFTGGVVINKAITIDGNGYTINGNDTYRIFNVTAKDVVLNNVALTKGKAATGGAIYVGNGASLTTSATFVNNTATNGGAIYVVGGGNLTVTGATFNEDGAVYIDNLANAKISNSEFTSDKINAIYNLGNLSLAGNTVKTIYNGGNITSPIKVLVLNGQNTVYANSSTVKLYANITDDNHNPIYVPSGFTFSIYNETANVNKDAVFNQNTLLYEADYTFPSFGYYKVNMTYTGTASNMEIINGTIAYIAGTFTDLQRLINEKNEGDTLELPYKFTYDATFDAQITNVVIDKSIIIDGKGYTISGNDLVRIFNVTNGATLTLTNATLTKGKANNGSAIYSEGDLVLNGVTFSENVAVDCGGAIYSKQGNVKIEDCVFDKNDLTNRKDGYEKDFGGAAIYSVGGTLKINGSKFTNNLLNYYPGVNEATRDKVTAAITSSGVTVVNNTAFENNSGTYGADLMVYKSSKIPDPASLTIDNSNFTNTRSYAGGIQIAKIDFNITNSNFDKNIAYGVGSTGYNAAGGAIYAHDCNNGIIKGSNFTNCGNTQGGAIDILDSKSLLIDGCIFKDNNVSTTGGAIAILRSAGDVTITNSDFINNTAGANAGAVYYWTNSDNKLTISNCEFKDNSAVTNGGAVFAILNPDGSVDVSNSNFTNNNAGGDGGAIFFKTLGSGNKLTISSSNFTDNGATNGEAVYTFQNTVTEITGSKFTNNGGATDYAIYNDGTLSLNNNDISNFIYNGGKITSQVIATILNNGTYETKEDTYTLNATLTDINGNLINDSSLRFVVNGDVVTDAPVYDAATGLYTYANYPITFANKGIFTVTVQLDNVTNLVTKSGVVKNLRVGTFTDLKQRIETATGDLILEYNFTYNADIDKDLKVINITTPITIDGKGYTISGNGEADIFIINADVKIKNTIFTNVASYAIDNNNTLELTNNTISVNNALIRNNGTITNAVVKILDGDTITIKYHQDVTLNATFKDDNGNLIEDSRFRFKVEDYADLIPANYENGLYTGKYTANNVGLKIVNVTNIGDSTVNTGKLNIIKAEVVINITANDTIERKQNESIKITLKDEYGYSVVAQLEVFIKDSNGKKVEPTYSPTTTGGEWSIEVPGLKIDNYTINVVFSANNNYYNPNNAEKRFEVVELDITNAFTELQQLIEAYEGTENVLVLPHDFKYDDWVDEDIYANGVLISQNIIIDGNGTTIDSDKVFRILNIADGITVTIKNVTFINGNATSGAAILTKADSLTIDSCNFLNNDPINGGAVYIESGNVTVIGATLFENNTADNGGAIYVANGGNLTVNGATFDNNTATVGGAIYVENGGILTLNGATFTNTVDDNNYTIYNLGTLALDSNTVDKLIYNGGKITTPVYSTVLGNTTYNIVTPTVEFSADLVDDNNNKIFDPEFRFVINGQPVATVPTYNATTGKYNISYTFTERAYVVNVTSAGEEKLISKISIFRNITGTFTELQKLIDAATDKLVLPYDFEYTAVIDDGKFPNGVVINKAITIDGNGSTINGQNTNRIFYVNSTYVAINDVTLTKGMADYGGAIFVENGADLTTNATFTNNTASFYGGAVYANSTDALIRLTFNNAKFIDNKADRSGGAICIESENNVEYGITGALFENNQVIYTGNLVDQDWTCDAGALGVFGNSKGTITGTTFRKNKVYDNYYSNGGAVKLFNGATAEIRNSIFEGNEANYTGAAIDVQSWDKAVSLTVENCTFADNVANTAGSAIASVQYGGESNIRIIDSRFTGNNAGVTAALHLDKFTKTSISGSNFTNNGADTDYVIYNQGTLELNNNNVSNIIYNKGTITTKVYSTVLNNDTYDIKTSTYDLNASLVDEMGNKIYDPNFRFVVNGATLDSEPTYLKTTGEYKLALQTATERIYIVDVVSASEGQLSTKTSIIRQIAGTFTDLQRLINEKAAGETLNLLNNFTYTPEIDDGSFAEGVVINKTITIAGNGFAINGNNSSRIFNVNATAVTISNINLVNGSAWTDGGAIYVAGGDLTVNGATFENNTGTYGAAINVAGGNLTIIGSTFNEDGAVYIESLGNAKISNSKFTSKENYAIENHGTLALSGNTVKLILNDGTITSTVIATLIEGKEIDAELGEKVTPNATLTDDSGNAIYDASFNITVRGNVLETTYDDSANIYTAEYTIANAGTNRVNTTYPATTIKTGIYAVPKANVTEFTVVVGDFEGRVAYGENATIVVTLIGVNQTGLNKTIDIIVNDTKLVGGVKVTDGVAIVNISGLAPGKYAAVGVFVNDDDYNDAYATGPFTVLYPKAVLNVTVEDITYGDIAVVNITLNDDEGNPITYETTIIINIGGAETVIYMKNGKASVEIPYVFAANEDGYLVNVTFIGDENYDPVSNDTEKLKVSKASIGKIELNASDYEVEAFDEVMIVFDIPVDGNYIWSENGENDTRFVPMGTYFALRNYTVGTYTIQIIYDETENYTAAASEEITITVKPKAIDPADVEYSFDGNYPDGLKITIWAPVDGEYYVNYNGVNYSVFVKDGEGIRELYDIDAGNYTANITIVDGNYSLPTIKADFKYKAEPNFNVSINGTYPTGIITIKGSDGTYHVTIGDATFNVTVAGNEGSTEIPFIEAGDYYANVVLDESKYYYGAEMNYIPFTIAQAELIVEPEVIGDLLVDNPLNITFTLPTDVNASNVVAFVDGVGVKEMLINETTGVYTLVLDGFDVAGGHAFTVEVIDPNYERAIAVKEFLIEKHNATMITVALPTAITYGENITVGVFVAPKATGFVVINVNGTDYMVDLNEIGIATKVIPELGAGDYDVTVTYGGDYKYNNATGSAKFTINKADSKVIIEPIADVVYGNPVEIEYNIINETSFVTISITDLNDPEKQIKYNSTETLVTIKDLPAGNYSISIHNGEDSNYNESRAEATFNVVKAATTITLAEYEINATIWEDVEIEFVVGPEFIDEGTVTLWINGEEYDNFTITQSDNSIKILSKYLPNATKYNITVQYIGSDNFNASKVDSLILNVNKINITDKIAIDGSVIVYGENGTIEVEFGDLANLTGTVSVTLFGVNGIYTADVESGYATVEIPGLLGNKTYPVQSVVYSGNDYYYGFTVNDERITIEVAPASSSVEINDIADVTYHGDVTVTYAVTNLTAVSVVVKDANGVEITKGINATVEGTVTISGLGAGKYTITVSNAASDNYNASSATKEFTVLKNSTITVEPVVIGDKVVDAPLNITFTLPTDVNSSYVAAYLDGVVVKEMLVNETTGVYTVVLDGFKVADGYRFTVEVNDPNYVEAYGEVSFIISKVTPEIVISDIAGNVGDTVKVNVTIAGGDATGKVILNNIAYDVKDGKATIDVVISTPGMQGITVEYTGDDKYFNGTANKGFNAGKGASTISFTDDVIDEFLDNDVEIEFVIAPGVIDSGSVMLWINDELYDEFIITQSVNSIKILAKYLPTNGTYNITAQYMGNELYNASNVAELTLNITKLNCTIDINVPESTTSPVFTVTLPEDAEGSLLVDIDGQRYYAPIVNGTASITVPSLVAGNYTANITYTGDDKYPAVSNTTTVNVPSNLPEDSISIPASASTYNPTYGVNLPKDASGVIEVNIDGKKYYAAVENGKASVSVPGLSTGAHNVTVTYSGDDKYTKISKSATVILTEPVVILVGTKVKVVYTDTATYQVVVTIDGARVSGKTVAINFNGKTYNVVTDSKGYATLKFKANVKPNKYKITASFGGVTIKNTVKVKNLIKAKDLKAKKSKKLKIKVSLKKVNGKYLKGKKLKLKFKGKTYKAKTNKKGKATFTIKKKVMKKLKKGKKYKYTVTYGKDKVTKKIKIKK